MESIGKVSDSIIVSEEEKETPEKRFRRLHDVKSWSFQAFAGEREELNAMVLKTGLTRKQAVLAALRKYIENMNKEDQK